MSFRSVILILFSIFFLNIVLQAESYKVRKLLTELNGTGNALKRTELLIEIGNEIKGANPDTALYYFGLAEQRTKGISDVKTRENIRCRIFLGRISIALGRGQIQQALVFDSIALAKAKFVKSTQLEAQALMARGSIFYYQGMYDQAQKYNHQALALNRKTTDRKTEGMIVTNMGAIEYMLGNVKMADSLFSIPLDIAKNSGDEDLMAASLLNIGLMSLYRGEPEIAESYFSQAIKVYRIIDGKDGLSICYQNLANIGFNKGDLAMAIDYSQRNLSQAMELDDKSEMSKALHNLGEASMQIGDLQQSLQYFLKSLDLKLLSGDRKEMATTYLSIGKIHYQTGAYDRALSYFGDALTANQNAGYKNGIAQCLVETGNVMSKIRLNDSALLLYQKAADIYNETQSLNSLAAVYLCIGNAYAEKNEFVQAEKFLNSGLDLGMKVMDKLQELQALSSLSGLMLHKSESEGKGTEAGRRFMLQARNYSMRSYAMADSMKNLPAKRDAAATLMEIYSQLGNFPQALHYSRLNMSFSDSLARMQNAEALANAEIRWNSVRTKSEIDRLLKEQTLQARIIGQKSKLNTQLIILLAVILLTLTIGIFAAVFLIRSRRKQRLLEYQNHVNEVTRLRMQNISNRLSPHLFFNILGNISAESDMPASIKEHISHAALLLRLSLENSEKIAVPVSVELDMVKSFVVLQEKRLRGPFHVAYQIDDTIDQKTPIPVMIIQIPVENAIKHGLMPIESKKALMVNISQNSHGMVIRIEDNGIGREQSRGRCFGTGTGLNVLMQTLKLLNQFNPSPITLEISDNQPQGTLVRVFIPNGFHFYHENF